MMLNKEKLKMWHALSANFLFVLNGVRKNTPGNIAPGKVPPGKMPLGKLPPKLPPPPKEKEWKLTSEKIAS